MNLNSAFRKAILPCAIAMWMLTGCQLASAPIDGAVREAGTSRPIPGAIVAVQWRAYNWGSSCPHVQEAITDDNGRYHIPFQKVVFFDAPSNTTVGSQIVYKEGYRDIDSVGLITTGNADYVGYRNPLDPNVTSATLESLGLVDKKEGDVSKDGAGKESRVDIRGDIPRPAWWSRGKYDQFMVQDIAPPSTRLEYLQHIVGLAYCTGAYSRNKNLVPLFEGVVAEAQKIAKTDKDKKILGAICEQLGDVATVSDDNGPRKASASDPQALKPSFEYLKINHPKCWNAVVEASKQTQRIVVQMCTAMEGCVVEKVVIKTCDMLNRCQEETVAPNVSDVR